MITWTPADPPAPPPLHVYIAAPWPLKAVAAALARRLEAAGLVVTSRWLHLPASTPDDSAGALVDLADIDAAHVLIAVNPPDWANVGTGGRHVEYGYALRGGKHLIVLGARSHVFHQLSGVTVHTDVEQLLERLGELRTFEGRP